MSSFFSPVNFKKHLSSPVILSFFHFSFVCLLVFLFQTTNTEADSPKNSPFRGGVSYEIFVRSFADSNGDGIGDLNGITKKLDYIKSLGVESIWLTPFYPSPTYHKYDVTNYCAVDPEYGTISDFKKLLSEAHKRKISVVIDLVLNHTSILHPWFQQSLFDTNTSRNPKRNYYVWASALDTTKKRDWHRIWDYKYYGMFWQGMPDLNYDNPAVRKEAKAIAEFWLKLGVDGLRLDAARHIYPDDEQEKSHSWWKEFSTFCQKIKPNVYIVGENWGSKEIIAPYFSGLEANFNFDLAYQIQRVIKQGTDNGLVDSLILAHTLYQKHRPDFIDATILSNHDQDRIASVFDGNYDKARLAATMLLTLPGSPYIYYGEELGMLGAKPDETIREPFLWDEDGKDKYRTTWLDTTKFKPFSTSKTIPSVAFQEKDPRSMLTFYKRLIKLRATIPALRTGDFSYSGILNDKVVSFTRGSGKDLLMVLHNLTGMPVRVNLQISYKRDILYGIPVANNSVMLPPYASAILPIDMK